MRKKTRFKPDHPIRFLRNVFDYLSCDNLKADGDPVLPSLNFESRCDIKHEFSQQPSHSSTLRNNYHIFSATANHHFEYQVPAPTNFFSQQLLRTPQAQWRLATKVHAPANIAAHIQIVATTTQETHATHDHAVTAATLAIALLTPPAVGLGATTLPTDIQTATTDQPAHAHPTAPHTPATIALRANGHPLVDLVVHPTDAITASLMSRLKRLLRQQTPMRTRRRR